MRNILAAPADGGPVPGFGRLQNGAGAGAHPPHAQRLPSPEAAGFALACYPEAGFHPITGSNRTNLAWGACCMRAVCPGRAVSAPGGALRLRLRVGRRPQWSFIPRSGVTFSTAAPDGRGDRGLPQPGPHQPLYSARFANVTDIAAANGMVTVTLSRANGALPALLDIPIVKGDGRRPLGTGPTCSPARGEPRAGSPLRLVAGRPCPGTPFPCEPFRRRTI